MPTWLYIALIWFASDNIMGYLQSPILFYPLVLIAGCLITVYQLGLMPILLDVGMPAFKQ